MQTAESTNIKQNWSPKVFFGISVFCRHANFNRSINILLSIAAAESLQIATIDIKTAFLYSPLQDELYVKRPPVLDPNIMPPLVKSNKCIHGLKQAAQEWRLLLDSNTL
jgi:hypothetical protein